MTTTDIDTDVDPDQGPGPDPNHDHGRGNRADTWWGLGRGDVALAAGLVGVAVLSGLFLDAARPDTIAPSTPWQWLLLLTPPALVAVRRPWPVGAAAVATVAQGAIWVSGLPDVLLPLIVLLFSAASDGKRQGQLVAVGCGVALTVLTGIGIPIADDVTPYQLPLVAITCGTAIALGIQSERQRATAAQLAAAVTANRLRAEHERFSAVADERARIARELHDIIGHTLATIAVRAEAADRVAARKPEAARDAVGAIAEASRSALDETRRVLAGLRSSTVDLAPPPDLSALRTLTADLGEAGVAVRFRADGCEQHVPPAVVVAGAYRIVQEALTNAVKTRRPRGEDLRRGRLSFRRLHGVGGRRRRRWPAGQRRSGPRPHERSGRVRGGRYGPGRHGGASRGVGWDLHRRP